MFRCISNHKILFSFFLIFFVAILDYSKGTFINHSILLPLKERYYPYFSPLDRLRMLDKLNVQDLQKGEKIMKDQKLIICGISRDNANDFHILKRHIEHLGEHFKDYKVVIFENDSKDATKRLLNEWQASNTHVKILSKDFKNKKRPNIQFMADVRNFYLDEIEKPEYEHFDVVAVIDMDMSFGFDIRGVFHSFAHIDEWDVVSANGLRHSRLLMYDYFAHLELTDPWQFTEEEETNHRRYFRTLRYPVGSDLVFVKSAFGGLAFYKKEIIKGCRYSSRNDECEHIPFHHMIFEKGGRIAINPSMIIKHSRYLIHPYSLFDELCGLA
jgi:hypothetical protein